VRRRGGESETYRLNSPPGTNCIFVLNNPSCFCLCAMLPCRERIVDRCPSSTTLSKPAIRIRANARDGRAPPADRACQGQGARVARILSEVDPAAVTGRAALARLPVTRKPDLVALAKAEPPFGGLNATPLAQLGRIFGLARTDLRPRRARPRLGARGARALCGGLSPGRGRAQHLRLPFHACGLDDGAGALALGCAVVPGGRTDGKCRSQRSRACVRAYIGRRPF